MSRSTPKTLKKAGPSAAPTIAAAAEKMAAPHVEKTFPKSWQEPGGQAVLDEACLAVQAAVREKYMLDAGCNWDFENGPDAPALLHMHIPGDEYDALRISHDDLEVAGERTWPASAARALYTDYSSRKL